MVWLFEFKAVELVPQERALQQLMERGYGEKYTGWGEPMFLIGVELSRMDRNIVGLKAESG